ncbi:hypothetical protein [Gordonia iterans]
MHDPWGYLAEHHPTVRVHWARLPGRLRGFTDGLHIWMDDRLTQVQRRVTVCHETIHLERGIICDDPCEERTVDELTARRLISTRHLVDALRWHRHPSLHGLAETLWVEPATVQCRLDTMDVDEQAAIEAELGDIAC